MAERAPAVRQAEEWISAAEGKLGIGFWSWDMASARLTCSPGLYALAGVNPASVRLDLPFLESLIHPKDRIPIDDATSFVEDSRQADRKFRIIRPDGQLRHLRSEARSLFDRDGNAQRVVAVVSDITDYQDTQRRLAQERALLHTVATLIDSTLWIADEDGHLIDRFGVDLEPGASLLSEDLSAWRAMMHPDDAARIPSLWREAARQRKPYRFSPRLRLADGKYHPLHIEALPFKPELSSDPYYGGIAGRRQPHAAQGVSSEDAILTPSQVRACRALLDWTAETLAQKAGISLSTVRRIESAETPNGPSDSLRLVTLAFREAGLAIWRSEDGRFCVSDVI